MFILLMDKSHELRIQRSWGKYDRVIGVNDDASIGPDSVKFGEICGPAYKELFIPCRDMEQYESLLKRYVDSDFSEFNVAFADGANHVYTRVKR